MPDPESYSLDKVQTTSRETIKKIFDLDRQPQDLENFVDYYISSDLQTKIELLSRQKSTNFEVLKNTKKAQELLADFIKEDRKFLGVDKSIIAGVIVELLLMYYTRGITLAGWAGKLLTLGKVGAEISVGMGTTEYVDYLFRTGGGILKDLATVEAKVSEVDGLITNELGELERQLTIKKTRETEIKATEPETVDNQNVQLKKSEPFVPYSRGTSSLIPTVEAASSDITVPKQEMEETPTPEAPETKETSTPREPVRVIREGPIPPSQKKEVTTPNLNVSPPVDVDNYNKTSPSQPIPTSPIPAMPMESSSPTEEVRKSTLPSREMESRPGITTTTVTKKSPKTSKKENIGVEIKTGKNIPDEGIESKSEGKIDYDKKEIVSFIEVIANQSDQEITKKAEDSLQHEEESEDKQIMLRTEIQKEKRNREIAKKYFETENPKIKQDIEKFFAIQKESFYYGKLQPKTPEQEAKQIAEKESVDIEPKKQTPELKLDSAELKDTSKNIILKTDPKDESEKAKTLARDSTSQEIEKLQKQIETQEISPEFKDLEDVIVEAKQAGKEDLKTKDENVQINVEKQDSDEVFGMKQTEPEPKKIEQAEKYVETLIAKEESIPETPSGQAIPSDRRSTEELSVVRNTVEDDRKIEKESAGSSIVFPIPVINSPPNRASNDQSQNSVIPLIVVNDEQIVRMNAFEAGKLRAV